MLLAKTYLEKVYATKPTCVGAAVAFPTEGNIDIFVRAGEPNPETLNSVMEEFKNNPTIFYFGHMPSGFLEEDMQPFSLIRGQDGAKNLLAGFFVGEFNNFKQEKSAHTNAFFAAMKGVVPEMMQIFTHPIVGEDLEKFNNLLDNPTTAGAMLKHLGGSTGAIVMMSATGKVFKYEHMPTAGDIEGGWASNIMEVAKTEKPPADGVLMKKDGEETPAERSARLKAKFLAAKGQTNAPAPSTVPAETQPAQAPVEPEKKEENPLPDTKPAEDDGFEVVEFKAPSHMQHKQQRKKFYEELWKEHKLPGQIPRDYNQSPVVKVRRKKGAVVKSFGEIGKVVANGGDTAIPTTVLKTDEYRPFSDDQAKNVIVVSVDMAKKAQEFLDEPGVKKAIDARSQLIADPKNWKDIEKEVPSFATLFKMGSLFDTQNWPPVVINELCRRFPDVATTMLLNWRSEALEAYEMMDKTTETGQREPEKPAARVRL